MGVHPPAANPIATRQRHDRLAKAAQHRAGQQHRATDLLEERPGVAGQTGILRAKMQRAALVADGDADLLQQLQHGADVADAWHVVKRHFAVRSKQLANSGSAAFLLPAGVTSPVTG